MRITTRELKRMKKRNERIPMLTAYDYTSARIVESAGIRWVLVGDSVGNNVLGYDSTLPVTMDDMLHHVKAVVRGTKEAHIVADMPFMSYQADVSDALRNAGRLIQDGGAQSVKLEGGLALADAVSRMAEAGIPVMGHIGFTPQSVNQLGGYRIQGKFPKAAASLLRDAQALELAGAYALVLELVPVQLAAIITERLTIPTIGIGAGINCDGQVQVFHDLLGMTGDFRPKHSRRYADLGHVIKSAVLKYAEDVKSKEFPADEESHQMDQEALEQFADDLS